VEQQISINAIACLLRELNVSAVVWNNYRLMFMHELRWLFAWELQHLLSNGPRLVILEISSAPAIVVKISSPLGRCVMQKCQKDENKLKNY
jgi:hypothetical protein